MLEKILNYIKNPTVQRNLLIGLVIVIVLFFRGCGDSSNDIDDTEYNQNIKAMNDTIRTYKNKNGELVHEKLALLGDIDDISSMNEELAKEIEYMKDHPIVVTKFKTKIVHDTVRIEVVGGVASFNNDSSVKTQPFPFDTIMKFDENNYRTLKGEYIVVVDTSMNITSTFRLDENEIGMSFLTGITENDNNEIEIFIKSDYPGFTPTSIEGAVIDPRKSDVIKSYFPAKRWGVSPYVGYGYYLDFKKGQLGHGVGAGVAVTYDLIQWK